MAAYRSPKPCNEGSNPSLPALQGDNSVGSECLSDTQVVVGSSPTLPTQTARTSMSTTDEWVVYNTFGAGYK